MGRVVVHKQVFRSLGRDTTVNTTICGRQSNTGEDTNVSDMDGEVTCKLCLKRMQQVLAALTPAGGGMK